MTPSSRIVQKILLILRNINTIIIERNDQEVQLHFRQIIIGMYYVEGKECELGQINLVLKATNW